MGINDFFFRLAFFCGRRWLSEFFNTTFLYRLPPWSFISSVRQHIKTFARSCAKILCRVKHCACA